MSTVQSLYRVSDAPVSTVASVRETPLGTRCEHKSASSAITARSPRWTSPTDERRRRPRATAQTNNEPNSATTRGGHAHAPTPLSSGQPPSFCDSPTAGRTRATSVRFQHRRRTGAFRTGFNGAHLLSSVHRPTAHERIELCSRIRVPRRTRYIDAAHAHCARPRATEHAPLVASPIRGGNV
jgi:hypothetical protein